MGYETINVTPVTPRIGAEVDFDGARTPKADKLPDSVKPLVRRNTVEIRNTQFGRDAEALANKVHQAFQDARAVTGRWPFLPSAAAWL
jgi:hypothetical protein